MKYQREYQPTASCNKKPGVVKLLLTNYPMGRKQKPPAYSCYDAPFNPNTTEEEEETIPPKPQEKHLGTLLNNELRREVHSYDAPRSHQLLNNYITQSIAPTLPQGGPACTWVPISSVIFPGDLSGRLAIIAHLKDPRRALVYLIKGERQGKDIPPCFAWQFIRIEPKTQKAGPTFKYVVAPKMCISSKKGCWLVWKEYFEEAPACIKNSKKSTKYRDVYKVPDYETRRITRDYERYIRGMEIPPPEGSIKYTGFEQFNLDFPTPDWKNIVCPLLHDKAEQIRQKTHPQRQLNDDEEEDTTPRFVKATHFRPLKNKRPLKDDSNTSSSSEDEDTLTEPKDRGFKYNHELDTHPALSVITSDSSEFRLLFGDEGT